MKQNDLGPLPKSDRNDELEQLSIKAFAGAFPVERFRIRSEPGKDTGVDRYLEVKVDGYDTNFRSQVQLKSMETASANNDGSVSKSIDVSNLNYLLNGPCPLYVLYIASTGQQLYAWVREVAEALSKKNSNWTSASSVTIRFDKILNGLALDEFENRIINEARTSRAVHQRLAQASRTESPRLEFDKDGGVIDSETAYTTLQTSGTTIIATGFPQRAVDLSKLLTPVQLREKRILLVVAYAQFVLSRYDLAVGSLRECGSISGKLSASDAWLYDEVGNACEYKCGRISREDFQRREREIAETQDGSIAAYSRLETLQYKVLESRRGSARTQALKAVENAVEDVRNGKGRSPILTLSAEIVFLFSRGHDIVSSIMDSLGHEAIRAKSGIANIPTGPLEMGEISKEWQKWFETAQLLLTRSHDLGHPILFADAQYTRAAVVCAYLMNILAASEIGWVVLPNNFERQVDAIIEDAKNAIFVYQTANCLESQLRGQMVLADLNELAGKTSNAIEIANEIHPICVAMAYSDLAKRSSDSASGESYLSRLRTGLQKEYAIDGSTATMTDHDAREAARTMVEAWRIPKDRTEIVYNSMIAIRHAAVEGRDWCRYIGLLEHLGHTFNVTTMYAASPPYKCVCQKLSLESEGSIDWESLIDRFKKEYCISCEHRNPLT